VRTPHPEYSRWLIRCLATERAFDVSTIPLHSRCPMLEVSESTWRPSLSRATAKYSPSATQKSLLNRRFRVAASFSSWSAKDSSCQTRLASRAALTLAS
jgi:hypothetical protein